MRENISSENNSALSILKVDIVRENGALNLTEDDVNNEIRSYSSPLTKQL